MIVKYYLWVSRFLTALELRYPLALNPFYFGILTWPLPGLLITAPLWATGIVIYFLPFPFDVRFTFWILLLIVTVVLALRTAYVLWKRNQR